MTKKSAMSVAKNLDVRCDEAYIFTVKVGAGCLSSVKTSGDGYTLFTLFINLIDSTLKKLKAEQQSEYAQWLLAALQMYMKGNVQIETPKENLSDKEKRKRIKNNEMILNELEAVL